ncbi:HAD-IA family hydrolase [Pseudomonas entomophila]|uniref:HAD family hydrolase n=1 Tax=Pseudomonas sp. RIT-PI-S TaxID=3035295 RepID=UPI0021DB2602
MNIKGVIFDSDGTLVDSERIAAGLLWEMLGQRDIHLPREEVLQRFRGVQFAVFIASLAQQYPWLDAEPFMQAFRSQSLTLFARGMQPMPGALAFVSTLRLPKCVASNGPRNKIETCLGSAGLLEHFAERIVSAYEVNAWKPAPGLILEAARVLQLSPHECLLVDDSHAGVEAGLAAGSWVAGFGEEDFSAYAQEPRFHCVPTYEDLSRLLERAAR